MKAALAPLMSSEKPDWLTPDVILGLVREVAPIALDPCTTEENPCRAMCIHTPAPFPSALPYFGPHVERFRAVFGSRGWIP